MSYLKNTAGQYLHFTLINASDGSAITSGTVTGYRTIDGGTQASVSGTITHKGNGQWQLALSQADTNGDEIGYLFTHTNGIPVSITIVTDTLKVGSLSIPTAVSIRQEIDTNSTKLDVAISTRLATAGYTAPDNASITNILTDTDFLQKLLAELITGTEPNRKYTTTALENAPTSGSNPGSTEITDILINDGTNPLEGAAVWINTDNTNSTNNVLWAGTTNASGIPKDTAGNNPFLDAGTYSIWCQFGGYTFAAPSNYTVGTPLTISGTAVSPPGSIAMSDLIDEVQNDLNDAGAAVWSETLLLQWLNDAIRDYSLEFPRRRTGTITAVASTHKYNLPADHLETISVEYPTAEDPPAYLILKAYTDDGFWNNDDYFDVVLNHDQETDDELWISDSPAGGETITVEYTAYHPHNLTSGEYTTVPSEHHHILRTYVLARATEWLQMAEQANPTSNSSLLMSMLAQNAEALRTLLERRKRRHRRHRIRRHRRQREEDEN